jgi:RNA polymerase sigma factor (sigma-70 family)
MKLFQRPNGFENDPEIKHLFFRYYKALLSYARDICPETNIDTLKGIVRNAYHQLYVRIHEFDGELYRISFLQIVVRDSCFLVLNQNNNDPPLNPLYTEPPGTENRTPEETIIIEEESNSLLQAIDDLDPAIKETFIMLFVHGLGTTTVAEFRGLSRETIRNHKNTAVNQLKVVFPKGSLSLVAIGIAFSKIPR